MKYTFKANYFRALLATAAVKDIRYYLNGILIDTDDEIAVATDGRQLLTTPVELEDKGDSIIIGRPDLAPAQSVQTVTVEPFPENEKKVLVIYRDQYGREKRRFVVDIVDGKYPDWKNVLPDTKRRQAIRHISFNPLIIAPTLKALGPSYGCVQFKFGKATDSIDIIIPADKDIRFIVMPCRT